MKYVLFSINSNRFKGTTTIILSSKLAPLVEDYGVINPRKGLILDFQIIIYYKGGGNVYLCTKLHNRVNKTLLNTN